MLSLTGAQECGLVPIVEPEILIEGDHSIEKSAAVAEAVLSACFQALTAEGARLAGLLLKPQMIIPGSEYQGPKPSCMDIAEHTLRVMHKYVRIRPAWCLLPSSLATLTHLPDHAIISDEMTWSNLHLLDKLGRDILGKSHHRGACVKPVTSSL